VRILIVEDHEDTRDVLVRLLEHWGFSVASAETLERGLDILRDEAFDAIVSDIALPDGTGYALVSEAKRRQQGVVTIALSGYNSANDVRIGKLSGFDYHLSKPFDCQLLRSILAQPGLDGESDLGSGEDSLQSA
jgi:CheY-like chemotaxis protein